jgi:hypothetical protein
MESGEQPVKGARGGNFITTHGCMGYPCSGAYPVYYTYMISSSTTPFPLDRFQSEGSLPSVSQPPKKPQRLKGAFLRGPIPMAWLYRAGSLPGKALAVGLLLWQEAGCRGSKTVRFRISKARAFACHHDTAKRGWQALEAAGLIRVRHIPGQRLEVTILDAPEDNLNVALESEAI